MCTSLISKEVIINIHRQYIESGSDIITTNTFGANDHKIKNAEYSVEEIIDQAILNAKEAAKGTDTLVALDIGPIGELLEPMGSLSFDDAYNMFKKQALCGEKSGADLVIVETMTDLNELRAAILAVKENTNLPVITTMTFEETGTALRFFIMFSVSSEEGLSLCFIITPPITVYIQPVFILVV